MCVGQVQPIKEQIFRLLTAHMKINQIPYVIFPATNQFSLIFAPPFIVTAHNFYEMS